MVHATERAHPQSIAPVATRLLTGHVVKLCDFPSFLLDDKRATPPTDVRCFKQPFSEAVVVPSPAVSDDEEGLLLAVVPSSMPNSAEAAFTPLSFDTPFEFLGGMDELSSLGESFDSFDSLDFLDTEGEEDTTERASKKRAYEDDDDVASDDMARAKPAPVPAGDSVRARKKRRTLSKTKTKATLQSSLQDLKLEALAQQVARVPTAENKRLMHCLLERRRRSGLREGYETLRATLPKVPSKGQVGTCDILRDAISYITSLKTVEQEMLRKIEAAQRENERLRQQLSKLD